jgi:hypothetical protein
LPDFPRKGQKRDEVLKMFCFLYFFHSLENLKFSSDFGTSMVSKFSLILKNGNKDAIFKKGPNSFTQWPNWPFWPENVGKSWQHW